MAFFFIEISLSMSFNGSSEIVFGASVILVLVVIGLIYGINHVKKLSSTNCSFHFAAEVDVLDLSDFLN